MKLNRKWLNEEFVDLRHVSDKAFAETLTVFGQKVETCQRLDADIRNVVVGKVLSIVRHEDSDHMWICQVDVGQEAPVQIVTGAQNVRQGDLVPTALHNSWLPGGVHITKGKLRGVQSNGMLCSFAELGLTQHDLPDACADGIWILNDEDCKPGDDINLVIGNDDTVVDFEITNNRPDCYSIIGLAREAAAAFGMKMKHHEPVVKGSDAGDIYNYLDVEVPATELCNRYSSRMVANVKVGPSPKWLRQRLRVNGVRPINNIVDITNYVMLEYGQPMHAFDYRYVSSGKIVVREAEAGETLVTLDGTVRELKPGMLVIADDNKPIGLAGIMGGENSEIVADTTMVVFESANFNGTSIRQTALALGMRTEASGKFEKNLDPMMTIPAVQRACELVELLGCGDVLEGTIDVINHVPEEHTLPLECDKINRLLGTNIAKEDMIRYLNLLEIPVEGDTILVPSFRPDLNLTADIAEEIGRSYGYNEIPTTSFKNSTQGGYSPEQRREERVKRIVCGQDYNEIITYSFISPKDYALLRIEGEADKAIRIKNPIGEDMSIMRTTLAPSMLTTLVRNIRRGNERARLFEFANVYLARSLPLAAQPEENKTLAFGVYGEGEDFFSAKGVYEAIAEEFGCAFSYRPAARPFLHPGKTAEIVLGGECVGYFGELAPDLAEELAVETAVYLGELDYAKAEKHFDEHIRFAPLPKFPEVRRDLALIADEGTPCAELEKAIFEASKYVTNVKLFDVYRSAQIGEGKKSMAFSVTFTPHENAFKSEDVDGYVKRILNALGEKFGAVLR